MYSIFSSIQSLRSSLIQQVSRSFSKITPNQLKIMAAVSIGFAVLGQLIYSALQSSRQMKVQQKNSGNMGQKTQIVFQNSQEKKLETPKSTKQPSVESVSSPVVDKPVNPLIVDKPVSLPVVDKPISPLIVDTPISSPAIDTPISPLVVDTPISPLIVDKPASPLIVNKYVSLPVVDKPVNPPSADANLTKVKEKKIPPSPDMDFIALFQEIEKKTDQSIDCIPCKSSQFDPNCRFRNILCPRATQVQLPGTSDDQYLHANHVELEGQHFIATQYPVTVRFSMFWSLCEQVSLVIDLTNEKDMQSIIDTYYPEYPEEDSTEEDSTEEQEYGDFLLKCDKRKDLDGINASLYTYHVKNKNEQKAKNSDEPEGFHVDRLHYKGWGDHLGITEDDLDQILAVIESYKDADKPVVVHCRAGVGRTGVVIVADALADLIKRQEVNESNLMDHIQRLILEGRKQRGNVFVQTKEQLEALWNWSWRRLHLAKIKSV